MADPLTRTFELLGSTRASAAVELLVAAADSPCSAIREKAVAALMRRGTVRCQMEVVRRIPTLTPAGHHLLEIHLPRLSGTLRQCLLHGDAELRANALSLVRTAECYDQVATLLSILEQRDSSAKEAACQTLQDLVNRLYEHCLAVGTHRTNERRSRNLPQARQTVLAVLEGSCNRFENLSYGREVVECALALGDPDNFAVRKILLHSGPACREVAGNLLLTSKHPGVMRLAFEFLGQSYPVSKALEAFETRSDSEFVFHILKLFPKRVSENQQKNFKQLARIAWIADKSIPLDSIPPALHESLAAFVQATGIATEQKVELQKWLMLHGSVPARLAASRVLESLEPNSVRGLLFGGLKSDDEDVQAWATSQLRGQGIPEAIGLLIERLDSSLPAVREAARGELESFNLELLLTIFDHLDRVVCLRAGRMVQKIDPACNQKLLDELRNPIRGRRIRAARAAAALGMARGVQGGLLSLLHDDDTLARRTAAEVLAAVPSPETVTALTDLLNDPSPRVREAAEHSLAELLRNERAASPAAI